MSENTSVGPAGSTGPANPPKRPDNLTPGREEDGGFIQGPAGAVEPGNVRLTESGPLQPLQDGFGDA